MKKRFLSVLIALGMFALVGCGDKQAEQEKVAGDKPQVEESSDKKDNVNDKAGEENKEADKEEKENTGDEKINLLENKIEKGEFKTYKPNENVDGITVNTTIKTENKTILDNLEKIIVELENNNFSGCKIEVKELKEIDGKNILLLDLKDNQKKWYEDYLQGSTGGFITESTLIDSFLQPDGTKLVDGVRFTLNGKAETEFNHAPRLSETNLRG